MCGIFFSLSTSTPVHPTEETCQLLRNRGSDSYHVHTVSSSSPYHLTFISTVLSLRGDHVHPQPLVDRESESVLCWNGEAWKVDGAPVQDNDTELIFKLFLRAAAPREADTDRSSVQRLVGVINCISGPFSFVFYDAVNSMIFFSRDCLGRRSLLLGREAGNLEICSLCDGTSSTHFEEVGTDGLHVIHLGDSGYGTETLPWNGDWGLVSSY